MAKVNEKATESARWTQRDFEHMAELCARVLDEPWDTSHPRRYLDAVEDYFVFKCEENAAGRFKEELFRQRVAELREVGDGSATSR